MKSFAKCLHFSRGQFLVPQTWVWSEDSAPRLVISPCGLTAGFLHGWYWWESLALGGTTDCVLKRYSKGPDITDYCDPVCWRHLLFLLQTPTPERWEIIWMNTKTKWRLDFHQLDWSSDLTNTHCTILHAQIGISPDEWQSPVSWIVQVKTDYIKLLKKAREILKCNWAQPYQHDCSRRRKATEESITFSIVLFIACIALAQHPPLMSLVAYLNFDTRRSTCRCKIVWSLRGHLVTTSCCHQEKNCLGKNIIVPLRTADFLLTLFRGHWSHH